MIYLQGVVGQEVVPAELTCITMWPGNWPALKNKTIIRMIKKESTQVAMCVLVKVCNNTIFKEWESHRTLECDNCSILCFKCYEHASSTLLELHMWTNLMSPYIDTQQHGEEFSSSPPPPPPTFSLVVSSLSTWPLWLKYLKCLQEGNVITSGISCKWPLYCICRFLLVLNKCIIY